MLWMSLSPPTLMTRSAACTGATKAAANAAITAKRKAKRMGFPLLRSAFLSQGPCHAKAGTRSQIRTASVRNGRLGVQKSADQAGQCTFRCGKLLQDREMVVAGERRAFPGQASLVPCRPVVGRLPLQLGQLVLPIGDVQRSALAGQVQERTVAPRPGEAELPVFLLVTESGLLQAVR